MVLNIEKNHQRFRQIVHGKIKKELKKYITNSELIGKKGKQIISIPVPRIDLPRFRFDPNQTGGVGQGDGDIGTVLGPAGPQGSGKAGDQPGAHILEVEISLEELAQMMGEELELPNIQPRGKKNISSEKGKYTSIARSGPKSLRYFKRTYKEALKRQIASGTYNFENPVIVPVREDERYRTWKLVEVPESNAVIIYMMDISGSMGTEQKEIVRLEAFWIDTWLRSQYAHIELRYIVHDAVAKEVDHDTFFYIREGGGTKISSAYKLCSQMIKEQFPVNDWNIYLFHFSDGDNRDNDDTINSLVIIETELLPVANLFCYGQVKSAYGSGDFMGEMEAEIGKEPNVAISKINSTDEILDSIKTFLGKGK
ncbi:MAG: hypothetical protein A2750_03165 [Candidatus Yanofskybacteria bacterium RIFCSPHIGHO2_01_FULL_45_42]|uniref:DUF444 family protein n=3 Tax=Candidatus Yanofskyibacteriota TaxID=1752733 RepID=A0A1F8H203_9BACT|nr:MAG: hypothetical protein A2750_03165 [Candidatus Yanofskybacteria bacterium RIFCSPHIGHO2_01_FULL_45_42]OGN16455.1 MAG: hypothetical protein A3C81_00615 [Candidatus Yanofskybacteria bacterium RIFCSPHIGHO2_02_FULL_46_19]OGN27356.1 MAG: hypothetical protein A3B17_00115 [Candidatus Yanofskybacteria bacterium RIFCSPLOWO2_01_FULL_45_72]OGN31677.1 MAG: hypothetical protein A3J01_02140 [Candidatus Yanofskybacteria bacterium RIFCSPLOWO2_02_FULL_45_18]